MFVHLLNRFNVWGEVRYSYVLRYCTLDTDKASYSLFYGCLAVVALIITFLFYVLKNKKIRKNTLARKIIVGYKQTRTTPNFSPSFNFACNGNMTKCTKSVAEYGWRSEVNKQLFLTD